MIDHFSYRIFLAKIEEYAVERYWGATVWASLGKSVLPLYDELRKLMDDPQAFVRSRAIVALGKNNQIDPVAPMKEALYMAINNADNIALVVPVPTTATSGTTKVSRTVPSE